MLRLSIVVSLLVAVAFGLGMSHMRASAGNHGGAVAEVDQGPTGPGLAHHPLFLRVRGRDATGLPLFVNSTPTGYTPSQVRGYLGLSGDGAGQTVAIVDAYQHPSITSDVTTFSSQFGLPLICGSSGADPANCFDFTVAMPQGAPKTNAGWALEIALDVEWAHAVAPKAHILLVETASNSFANLLGGIDYAASQGAAVISNSWGGSESASEASNDSHCQLAAAVCTFSTGDSGNPGGYPAYNPAVIAVGGTTLNLAGSTVSSESAWSGSGGGISQYETRPAYQAASNASAFRGIPDVSYDADPNTGFPVYDSVRYQLQSGWFQVGGTSAGAPQWAAIVAVADQLRAANGQGVLSSSSLAASNAVYALNDTAALYDVTSGSNGSCGSVCQAGTGYDFVTGLGSPRTGVDLALAGVSGGSSTPTPTSTSAATATPTATSAPPTAPATATPTSSGPTATATATTCPPGKQKRGAC